MKNIFYVGTYWSAYLKPIEYETIVELFFNRGSYLSVDPNTCISDRIPFTYYQAPRILSSPGIYAERGSRIP